MSILTTSYFFTFLEDSFSLGEGNGPLWFGLMSVLTVWLMIALCKRD